MDGAVEALERIRVVIVNLGKIAILYLDDLGEWGIIILFFIIPIFVGSIFSIFCRDGKRSEKIRK